MTALLMFPKTIERRRRRKKKKKRKLWFHRRAGAKEQSECKGSLQGDLSNFLYIGHTRTNGSHSLTHWLLLLWLRAFTKTGQEELSFKELVAAQPKKVVAGAFFEFLVLKTRNRIDLRQEEPFGDITISKTVRSSFLDLRK